MPIAIKPLHPLFCAEIGGVGARIEPARCALAAE